MSRVSQCIVCGGSRCMEFEDKFYCFRFGVTRKKTKGIRERQKKDMEVLKRGFGGGTFSKVPPPTNQQETFDFGSSHIKAIEL